MENHKDSAVFSNGGPDLNLTDEQVSRRTVVISKLPANTEHAKLYIHFQKKGNGGGEIKNLKLLDDGRAILTYEEAEVAESVLQKQHEFGGTFLQLEPYKKTAEVKKEMEVFSLVSAKINPAVFNMATEELIQSLKNIKEKAKVNYIELCDGIWVSGTYKQIEMTCSMLATIATPREARENAHMDFECTLDVQPKLMYILRRKIQEIQDKYEMKIENSSNGDKAVLSPVGKKELFEEGKEEFINLYQKAFQEMDEKRFELDTDNSAAEKTFKELMDDRELNVVIDRKDKEICIYGRSNDVGKAMQRLQGKPRRSRKSYKGDSNDELMKPDTYAQLPKTLKQTLENGVTVSVYQGDITQQHVDVIVNAANERLDHGGGVAGAIVKHGGYQIQQESTQIVQYYGLVPVGKVASTGPGRLPCKKIIHAVGPQWWVHGPEGSRQLIFNACWNSFVQASQFGAGSIAIPGISSGIYGVPKEVCAEMMFTAAEAFSCESNTQNRLRDIRFVNIDSPTNEAFRKEFHKRYVEKRSSGFENGPQSRKDLTDNKTKDKNGSFVYGGQTNKGPQVPAGNPSDDLVGRTKQDKPGSYAAAAAVKRWEANQPKAGDSKPPLQDKATTDIQPKKDSFQQGYANPLQRNREPQTPAVDKLSSKDEGNNKADSTVAAGARAKHEKSVGSSSTLSKEKRSSDISSFQNGFKDRQQSTSRGNTEQTQGNLSEKESLAKKNAVKNLSSLVKAPQESAAKSNGNEEEKIVESPSVTQEKDLQPGYTDSTTTVDKTLDDNQNLHEVTSIPPDKTGEADGRGRARNGRRSNEAQFKFAGRGRGAAHVASIAAKFDARPGTAVRDQETILKNSPNPTVKTPEREVKHPPGCVSEHPAALTAHPRDLQHPENLQEQPTAQPPGLKVTEEGLSLAETCNMQDGIDGSPKTASLPSKETSEAKTSAGNKRKIDQDDSLKSPPKLRKEDAQDHDTKVKEYDENEQEQESKRDGDNENELSNQVTKENDKEIRKEKDMELQDSLNALSEKEKERTDKSTTEEDETVAVKSRESVPIETIEKSAISEIGANKNNNEELEIDRLNDKLEDKTDQKDEAKNKDGGNDGEDDERQNGDEELKGSTDKASVNEEDKDIVGDKDIEVTQSPEKIHIDPETEDKAQQDDETAMNSFVVLSLSSEGEQQTCREHQQGHKRVSEDSSSSESIEFVDAVDQDLSPFHDASYLESQSDLNQSSEKTITEENSSEGDTPSVSKCRAGKEQPAASDENEEVKKQGVEDTSGGHTQAPLVDQSDHEGQTSSEGNDTKASRNIRSGATETSSPQDQSLQSKDETSTEENSEYREDGTKRVDDAHSEDKQNGIERVDDLQSSNRTSQTDPETKHKQDGTERLDDAQSSLTSQTGEHESDDLVQALGALSLSKNSEDSSEKENTEPLPLDQQKECSLCKTAFSSDRPEVILSGCGHVVCKDCKLKYKETQNVICPSCEKTAGCNVLQPPGGQMKHGILQQSLEGHSDHKTIYIDYHFPAGIQGSCHPKPGSRYDELVRRTFLPDTEEGRKVLELFDKAFKAGLLFTIGKCTISDPHKENQIVFCNEVEHKINIQGGPSYHGYPDPEYLVRVTEQLRAIGIE